jgi:hypothetical protein
VRPGVPRLALLLLLIALGAAAYFLYPSGTVHPAFTQGQHGTTAIAESQIWVDRPAPPATLLASATTQTISIVVVDAHTRSPLVGAEVSWTQLPAQVAGSVYTDARGFATVVVPLPHMVVLSASMRGYDSETIRAFPQEVRQRRVMALTRLGRIDGRVVFQDGRSVADATVHCWVSERPQGERTAGLQAKTTTTLTDGSFAIEGVPCGRQLHCEAISRLAMRGQVDGLLAPLATPVVIALESGHILRLVIPIPAQEHRLDVVVRGIRTSTARSFLPAVLEAQGHPLAQTIAVLRDGTYDIQVRIDDRPSWSATGVEVHGDTDIVMPWPLEVSKDRRFVVKDAERVSIQNAVVRHGQFQGATDVLGQVVLPSGPSVESVAYVSALGFQGRTVPLSPEVLDHEIILNRAAPGRLRVAFASGVRTKDFRYVVEARPLGETPTVGTEALAGQGTPAAMSNDLDQSDRSPWLTLPSGVWRIGVDTSTGIHEALTVSIAEGEDLELGTGPSYPISEVLDGVSIRYAAVVEVRPDGRRAVVAESSRPDDFMVPGTRASGRQYEVVVVATDGRTLSKALGPSAESSWKDRVTSACSLLVPEALREKGDLTLTGSMEFSGTHRIRGDGSGRFVLSDVPAAWWLADCGGTRMILRVGMGSTLTPAGRVFRSQQAIVVPRFVRSVDTYTIDSRDPGVVWTATMRQDVGGMWTLDLSDDRTLFQVHCGRNDMFVETRSEQEMREFAAILPTCTERLFRVRSDRPFLPATLTASLCESAGRPMTDFGVLPIVYYGATLGLGDVIIRIPPAGTLRFVADNEQESRTAVVSYDSTDEVVEVTLK